jgi:hypothetical protein
MKRNPKPPKASTASSADNITLDDRPRLLVERQMIMEANLIKMATKVLLMK